MKIRVIDFEAHELTLNFLLKHTTEKGRTAELYAFCYNNDIQILLTIIQTATGFLYEITRNSMGGYAIYYNNNELFRFTETTFDTLAPGYYVIDARTP
ncbi:MAG: hypothetical protein ACE5L6_02130 [Candidatus Bathyarchaeia archaeon]